MTIHVTQDHIDAANYLSQVEPKLFDVQERDPLALAMKSQGFPDATSLGGAVYDGFKYIMLGPPATANMIEWYCFGTAQPFDVEL